MNYLCIKRNGKIDLLKTQKAPISSLCIMSNEQKRYVCTSTSEQDSQTCFMRFDRKRYFQTTPVMTISYNITVNEGASGWKTYLDIISFDYDGTEKTTRTEMSSYSMQYEDNIGMYIGHDRKYLYYLEDNTLKFYYLDTGDIFDDYDDYYIYDMWTDNRGYIYFLFYGWKDYNNVHSEIYTVWYITRIGANLSFERKEQETQGRVSVWTSHCQEKGIYYYWEDGSRKCWYIKNGEQGSFDIGYNLATMSISYNDAKKKFYGIFRYSDISTITKFKESDDGINWVDATEFYYYIGFANNIYIIQKQDNKRYLCDKNMNVYEEFDGNELGFMPKTGKYYKRKETQIFTATSITNSTNWILDRNLNSDARNIKITGAYNIH